MFKILKWVYNLGVQNERVRIARALEGYARGADMSAQERYSIFNKDPSEANTSENRRRKAEIEYRVLSKVSEIVGYILKPQENYKMGPSIMFPNKKGEEK